MKFLLGMIAVVLAIGLSVYWADDNWPPYFAQNLPKADSIYVSKSLRTLTLIANSKQIKTYRISLGENPVGSKCVEGDSKTPEGDYYIEWKNRNSKNYRALKVSYPDSADIENARKMNSKPGGDIMVHGITDGFGLFGGLYSKIDWTSGCIAVDNISMAEIWSSVENGTPIKIVP